MNTELSRISGLVDSNGTTHLADYTYLGRNRTAQVDFPSIDPTSSTPGVKFTWLWQTGDTTTPPADPYTGWDRFGRAVDLRWIKNSSGAELERLKHGYDEASNRKYRKNVVAEALSKKEDELYGYDGLYQLKEFQRGLLNGGNNGMSGTIAAEEDFAFDPTGNWNSYVTQINGNPALNQTRLHNKANELTEIDSSAARVAEDAAGNMTKVPQPSDWVEKYDLTYDAWNRLVKVADGETTVATYAYDGLHRRTKKVIGSDTRHYYYSDRWQILEERVNTSSSADRQFVWGLRYIDDLILRDRELGEEDERLYVIQDYFQPTAVMNTSGTVLERYGYDAFGTSRVMEDDFDPKAGGSDYEWETRYGAYRWDGETGLYQVRYRYLHSGLGRWVTRDPIGRKGGLNLYRYAWNSPLNRVDPFGLFAPPVIGGPIITILIPPAGGGVAGGMTVAGGTAVAAGTCVAGEFCLIIAGIPVAAAFCYVASAALNYPPPLAQYPGGAGGYNTPSSATCPLPCLATQPMANPLPTPRPPMLCYKISDFPWEIEPDVAERTCVFQCSDGSQYVGVGTECDEEWVTV